MTGQSWLDLEGLAPAGATLVQADPRTTSPSALSRAEAGLSAGAPAARRREHAAGRIGARVALTQLGVPWAPVLRRSDGSPDWPADVRGSISHKSALCVATAAPVSVWSGVGLDVEHATALPLSVRERVLTPGERGVWPDPREVGPRLAFSAKEAYYKWHASCGHAGRPDFHDVEVRWDGSEVSLVSAPGSSFPPVSGRCRVRGGWIVVLLWSPAREVGQDTSSA